jgi:hypothetical protein
VPYCENWMLLHHGNTTDSHQLNRTPRRIIKTVLARACLPTSNR